MRDVKVPVSHMLMRVGAFLFVEVLILTAWTATDDARLYYTVVIDEVGANGMVTDSHGECTASNPWPFMGTLIALHGIMLIYGNVLCYRARKVLLAPTTG